MELLDQFLDRLPDGSYRLYHATFPEFLTGQATAGAADPFHLDPGAWHELIAGRLIRANPNWLTCTDGYALAHTPSHLTEALRLQTNKGKPENISALSGLLIDLVTDSAWHDRLRAVTGGDTAALAELTMTIQLLTIDPAHLDLLSGWQPGMCTHPNPDLTALARIVWHRDRLHHRNRAVPTNLPAVWVRLGQPTRAENLARAIPKPRSRANALTMVSGALTRAGQHHEAERIAESIDDPEFRAKALLKVAEALTLAGQHQQAERVAEEIRRAGEKAEQVARGIDDPEHRAGTLLRVMKVLTEAGLHQDAKRLAEETRRAAEKAERVAMREDDPRSRAHALTSVVVLLARAEQQEDTQRLAATGGSPRKPSGPPAASTALRTGRLSSHGSRRRWPTQSTTRTPSGSRRTRSGSPAVSTIQGSRRSCSP